MRLALEIHLYFAFFVFLMGLFLGWVQLGRRVVVTVIGIQIAIGVAVAADAGVAHMPMPGSLWVHVVGALLALASYIVARRVIDRNANLRIPALAVSLLGLFFIVFTIWYGTQLHQHIPM